MLFLLTSYLRDFHTKKTTHSTALSQPPAYTLNTNTHTHTQGHLRPSPFKTKPLPVSTALNYTLSFPTKQTHGCCCYSALVVTPANKEWGKATRHSKHAPPWHHCITHPSTAKGMYPSKAGNWTNKLLARICSERVWINYVSNSRK